MKKKYVIIFIVLIFLLLISVFVYKNIYLEYTAIPKITIIGDKSITLEVNDNYQELGAKAYINEQNETKKIKIKSNINTKKIGEYQVKYIISNHKNKHKQEKLRNIKIVDKELPNIKLNGDDKITIYENQEYEELGYIASDNYDGDITNKVQIKNELNNTIAGEYRINYTVCDSSNNCTDATRNIAVKKSIVENSGIPILMYHFFYDKNNGISNYDNNFVEISDFEKQMKYLKDNNYYFPSWEEILKYLNGEINLPEKSIVITNDDGSNSFFELAVPLIEKYQIKVTSFLVTSWTDPNKLSVNQNYITFMSHSNNMHKGGCNSGHGGLFLCINQEKGYEDIKTSIDKIGNNLVFAYPFGDYNDQAIAILKRAQVKLAVTTNSGRIKVGDNPLLLPRVRISKNTTIDSFINLVK